MLSGQLLTPHPTTSPPDMNPFFLKQYVKSHASDVFEEYTQLVTEVTLRVPHQVSTSRATQLVTEVTLRVPHQVKQCTVYINLQLHCVVLWHVTRSGVLICARDAWRCGGVYR